MSNVVSFQPRQSSGTQSPQHEPCQIIIFSGVRIERIGDDSMPVNTGVSGKGGKQVGGGRG